MRYFVLFYLALLFAACRPETYVPKPRGYYKIDLPEHAYQHFEGRGFPYSFDFPTYGAIAKDTSDAGKQNPYWINIYFPSLGGTINFTYKEIDDQHTFSQLLKDAHELSFTAHGKRADFINNVAYNTNGVHAVFYTIGGDAATRYQFFATDSVKHFLRGALYFDVTPNADSLQPVNDFLATDMKHLIETLRWK